MGLTTRKEEQLKQMPLIRTKIAKIKNGTLVIHKTEIIDVKPAAYYEAVLKGEANEEQESLEAVEA